MEKASELWYLEGFDLFQNLKQSDILRIEKSMHRRVLRKKTVLHFPQMLQKYVYLLKKGIIKIATTLENGKEFIKYLLKPGNLFGEIPMIGSLEGKEDFAMAVEDATICFIDSRLMEKWMLENRDLMINVFKQIGSRVQKVQNRLLSMIFKDVKTRIIEFLTDFAIEFGKKEGNKYVVKNFLTQEDIAKLTATSRQTVSNILKELSQENLIEYKREKITVHVA
jgi:CRP-like cAMP-binding protein